MSETGDNGRLTVDMPAGIPAAERDALGHPYRRQILRALGRQPLKLSPSELTESGLLPCTAACAAYHLQVLANSGLADPAEPEAAGSGIRRRFSSLVGPGSPVLTVLRETEQPDRRRLATAAP